MTQDNISQTDGLVLYTDGSFRRRAGGWGIHGYTYKATPLTRGIGIKQLPTAEGYKLVEYPDTVTPLEYIDAFGTVTENPTNNTAELQAAIEAFKIGEELGVTSMHLLLDSEYVRKGLTQHVKGWINRNWLKADGEPVANQDYWKTLVALEEQWKAAGKKLTLAWIKGHSDDTGNDLADLNALTGSGGTVTRHVCRSPVDKYHNPTTDINPLVLKTRLLFNMGYQREVVENKHYYYLYQLGRMATYGHKQHDTTKDRHDKTDLLLGRRIADATFCVMQVNEPDRDLEGLIELHTKAHQKDIIELAVARLDNAFRPGIYQRIQQLGAHALISCSDNNSLVTPQDDLITKTLNPPRLAREAVDQFSIMQTRLDAHLSGQLGSGVTAVEITDALYAVEGSEKKAKLKLLKTITNTLASLDVPVEVNGHPVTLKLLLGVDIPQRNTLAKLADHNPKVTVLVVANGPAAYSFATVFETGVGNAIYQSPYTQFVLPKRS